MQPQGSIIPSIKLTLCFLAIFSMIEEEGLLLLQICPSKSGLKQDSQDSPKPVVMGSFPLSSAFFTHLACRETRSSMEAWSIPTPTSFYAMEDQREVLLMNPMSIKLRSWWDLVISSSSWTKLHNHKAQSPPRANRSVRGEQRFLPGL